MGEAELESVLLALWDEDRMRAEAQRLGLHHVVAGRTATPAQVAADFVKELVSRGLHDAAFFAALMRGRDPRTTARVRACAEVFGVDVQDQLAPGERERLDAEVEAVAAELVGLLDPAPAVTAALARSMRLKGEARGGVLQPVEPATVVRHALNTQAADVVEAIADAYDRVREQSDLVKVLRALLEVVLPLAIDHRELVALARSGQNHVLPLRTTLLAEIIRAGVDGRRCAFVIAERSEGHGAEACLRLRAEGHATLRFDPSVLLNLIVDAVAADLQIMQPRFEDRLAAVRSRLHLNQKRALRRREDNEERHGRPLRREDLPRYLLVIDRDDEFAIQDHEGRPVDPEEWQELLVAAVALGKLDLPVLRLTGGAKELEREDMMAHLITRLYETPR